MKEKIITKDIEIYLLAQFIDVLEDIENINDIKDIKKNIKERKNIYKENIENMLDNEDIFDVSQLDLSIDEKLERYSKIYCKTKTYKEIEEKIKNIKESIEEKLEDKKQLEELEDLIYEKCNFDFKFSYKLRLNRWNKNNNT